MRKISGLLILCILLLGCSREEALAPIATSPTERLVVQGFYDKASNLEISSSGALQVFPLGSRTGKGLTCFGDGLLLFSQGENTTLTLLTGETLVPTARANLDFSLDPENCAIHGESLSYFDPVKQQTLRVNTSFQVLERIPAPAGLTGTPVLSPDGAILYYCTASAIMAWDLSSGIHRTLRQTAQENKSVHSLYLDGQVLRYLVGNQSYFLSTETGELLAQEDSELHLAVTDSGYIAATWESSLWSLVFQQNGETLALTPRTLSADFFLLGDSMAVITAATAGEALTLDHYDLVSGKRTATQMLRSGAPCAVAEQDSAVYALVYLPDYAGQAIIRWDVSRSPVSDSKCYTGPHFTAKDPDIQGLTQCQAYADEIGDRYGLTILIWRDGASLAPEGITARPEYRVNLLRRELELLDDKLSQFPPGLLNTTAANFGAFQIGLVAQISGGIQEESLSYFRGEDACILLSVGDASGHSLYNALFCVMQTHILSHSSALDRWDTLNPQGFRYDYDYSANAIRNSGMYLTEKNRSFIDTFSMSYPKEDRARVFEYAMLPGQEDLFQTQAMQKKLAAVCDGIREAYSLDPDTAYPWEQYLR